MPNKCTLCGCKDYKILFYRGLNRIVKCKKCGLIFHCPTLVKEKEIEKYIHGIYPTEYIEKTNRSKKILFLKFIRKINSQFNNKPKILDIGCGNGYFMKLANKFGWEVLGIEPSNFLVSIAEPEVKDKIIVGTLRDMNFKNNYFDIITLWDVFDWLRDPVEELKEMIRILKKGGLIIMRVRNMDFHLPMRFIFPHFTVFHLYGYNSSTIKKVLELGGFKGLKVLNSILTKSYNISDMFKSIFYYFCLFIYFSSFKKIIVSPSIIVYATKKD